MVAIIKKNFRLQNARDFLENVKSHPRGLSPSLESSVAITAITSDKKQATASYTWTWDISNTVSDASRLASTIELKKDSLVGLRDKVGSHVVDRNHYLFVGKTTPWTKYDENNLPIVNPAPELSPAPASDTAEEERRVWDDMLGLKKLSGLDAALVVPRFDWDATGQTVYRVYDDRNPNLYAPANQDEKILADVPRTPLALKLGSFYVINSEFDLFVCVERSIDPLTGYPRPSTEEPRRTQSPRDLIDYSEVDGYVWKYITTITSSDVNKFATDHWIPIRTLTAQQVRESDLEEIAGGIANPQAIVQKNAVAGSVVSCIVDNAPEQVGSYIKTHTGVLTSLVNGTTSQASLDDSATTEKLDSQSNAYNGMHLYIIAGPASCVGQVYTIQTYTVGLSGKNITLASGESWPADLLTYSSQIEYEILPIVTTVSNGTSPVKIKPVISNGRLYRVKVIDPGAGATFVRVFVGGTNSDGNVGSELNTTVAKVRAVLSPALGLGADPEKDLGAHFVMLNARLSYDENSGDGDADFPLSNDYRQIGIIRDVLDKDGDLATKNTYGACKSLNVQDITTSGTFVPDVLPFVVDETITQTYTVGGVTKTAQAILIDVGPTSGLYNRITYVQTPDTGYVPFHIDVAGTYKLSTENGTTASVAALNVPEIKKFSGEILYLENRRAILRAQEQTEDIKAIIEF